MKKHFLSFTILAAAALLWVASCKKDKSAGTGQTCKCGGGFTGMGLTENMDSLTYSEAAARCASYNSPPNSNDGFGGCHLE